jgi:glutamate racemase
MRSDPRELPIAVFDSGVGLTVLHECLVALGHEDFVYLGDTARFPYGQRSRAELESFALELAELLVERGAKLLVVACNSATAAALPRLRAAFGDRLGVVGVVEPESAVAARVTRTGAIGLLATPATVASGAYDRALRRAAPHARLHAVACPDLASLVQEGGEVDERIVDSVDAACAPLRAAGVDTVILGCTHYGLVGPVIRRALGRAVRVVTSGEAVVERIEHELSARGLGRDVGTRGTYSFLCSGDPESFRRLGTRFLQLPLGPVQRVGVAAAPAPARVRRAA